jgi:hypothetical protein
VTTKRIKRVFPGFTLQPPVSDIQALASRYSDDDTKALAAGKDIAGGKYTRTNLMVIVDWKSKRRAALLKENTDDEIEEALHLAVHAAEPRTAFGVLTGLSGVGVPMASAILTGIDQTRYAIIDWRALHALGVRNWPIDVNFYLKRYYPECSRMAQQTGFSLRTIDRALWQWSVEKP